MERTPGRLTLEHARFKMGITEHAQFKVMAQENKMVDTIYFWAHLVSFPNSFSHIQRKGHSEGPFT